MIKLKLISRARKDVPPGGVHFQICHDNVAFAGKMCAGKCSNTLAGQSTVALGLELERDENGTKGKVGARVTGNPALSTY